MNRSMRQIASVLALVALGCSSLLATSRPVRAVGAPVALGAYIPLQIAALRTPAGLAPVDQYAQKVGREPAIIWSSQLWSGGRSDFPAVALNEIRQHGIMPMVTWEPSAVVPEQDVNQPAYSWSALASGDQDTYIRRWATAAAAYHYPVYVRLMHEMDGNWYPWGAGVNGNTNPADFVDAWRHIVSIFRSVGASNVLFVWCADARAWTPAAAALYPGDAYVDWVAIDGYNANPHAWISLQDRIAPSYDAITAMTQKPLMIAEVASQEDPNSPSAKANWITQGFLTAIPQSFPRVRAVLWFNRGITAAPSLPVDSSPASLAAFQQVVANPYYQGSMPGSSAAPAPSPAPASTSAPATATPAPPTATVLPTSVPTPIATIAPRPTATPNTGANVKIPLTLTLLGVRAQGNARAEWTHRKGLKSLHRGQRVAFVAYVLIRGVTKKSRVRIVWQLRHAGHPNGQHREQHTIAHSGRYTVHWFRRFAVPGSYTVSVSIRLGKLRRSHTIKFRVLR